MTSNYVMTSLFNIPDVTLLYYKYTL